MVDVNGFTNGDIYNADDQSGMFAAGSIDQITAGATSTWESPAGVELDFTVTNAAPPNPNQGESILIAVNGPAPGMAVDTLGRTTWRSNGTSDIHATTMIFSDVRDTNGATATIPWSFTGTPTTFSLAEVITHEVGHVAGLDHNMVDATSIMWESIQLGGGSKQVEDVDEFAIRYLYPPSSDPLLAVPCPP